MIPIIRGSKIISLVFLLFLFLDFFYENIEIPVLDISKEFSHII
jgi:hypothetical protein